MAQVWFQDREVLGPDVSNEKGWLKLRKTYLLLDFPLLLLFTSLSSSSSSSLSDESSSLPFLKYTQLEPQSVCEVQKTINMKEHLLVVGTLESSLSLLGFGGDP